jgi:ribonuclease J
MSKFNKDNLNPDNIHFIPLGGSEQFGVNFNLYAYKDQFLAIDCGIGFADHRYPGIDIMLPDPQYIADQREKLVGLIITHAHEDHIGAVPHLWPRLQCPIYCTEFTAKILRRKFDEYPNCKNAQIHVVKAGESVDIGVYKAHFIPVAHSIPDTASIVLETDVGKVIHSGDWNLDPTPVIGARTEEKNFKPHKGAMAYVGDSTNSNVEGRSVSEKEVEAGLAEVFKGCKKRIAITIFSSNIGRIRSIAKAAAANDRSVALVGRSLHNMAGAAIKCGYLNDVADFISDEDLSYLPEENQVLIVTGSQGEGRAALAKIARGEHRDIRLSKGDTVIFSSRAIPGNEAEINHVKNNLVASGVRIIATDNTEHCIHVSGHPRRDEVAEMYQWVKPKTVIPVHGERMQLEAQADLARSCQIENVIVPNNGSIICLGPDKPEIIDHVETGLIAVDARRLVRADHHSIVARRKMQYSGVIHISLVVNDRGDLIADPEMTTDGILDLENADDIRFEENMFAEIEDIFVDMKRKDRQDDHFISEEIRIGLRRFVFNALGMKPKTTVHVIRV